jgi:hypothetical protein
MDPLDVDTGHLCRNLLSQFDTAIILIVLGTLHSEASQNETLLILCDLLLA